VLLATVVFDLRIALGHQGVPLHRGVCTRELWARKKLPLGRTCEGRAGEDPHDLGADRREIFQRAREDEVDGAVVHGGGFRRLSLPSLGVE
jgi:hypothetical protein